MSLERIENKLDKLDERLDSIDVKLAVYNEQLGIHIKRSDTLQAIVTPIHEERIAKKAIQESREASRRYLTWGLGILTGLSAIIVGVSKLF